MNDTKHILFNPHREDGQMFTSVIRGIAHTSDLRLEKENYDDGTWSGWYKVTSDKMTAAQLDTLALAMEQSPLTFGTVMVRKADGDIQPPTPVQDLPPLGVPVTKNRGPKGPGA